VVAVVVEVVPLCTTLPRQHLEHKEAVAVVLPMLVLDRLQYYLAFLLMQQLVQAVQAVLPVH
jgi:hypothetical protein